MASSGCRKAAIIAGIGCLGVPIALALVFAVTLWVARTTLKDEGPAQPRETSLSIPSGDAPAPPPEGVHAPDGPPIAGRDLPEMAEPGAAGPAPPATHLTLDMEEGEFRVGPGPPGTDIRVDGLFDPRDYEMTHQTEEGAAGREVRVRFRARRSWFLRLLAGRLHDSQNKVTVTIPEGMPTAVTLRLAKSQSHVDLGGLTLTGLDASLAMGEHDLGFSRPLQGNLSKVSIQASMGEIRISGMGNAHPSDLSLNGSMGEFRVDLGGAWPAGSLSKVRIRHSMGEVRIVVPPEVRIAESSRTRVSLGESRRRGARTDQPEDPNAPSIELDVTASMGEVTVVHD